MNSIRISSDFPVRARNAGLYIARGVNATHAERIMDSFELIFVRQGVLSMREEEQEFIMTAGQTLTLYPGHQHAGTAPYSEDLQFYWIHFDVADVEVASGYEVPQVASASRPDYLTMLFRVFLENQELVVRSKVEADLLMMLILAEVAHFSKRDEADAARSKLRLVARAEAWIALNIDKPISTSDLARSLDVNPDYLGRVFHTVTGKTITETIHFHRLKKAKLLLMEADDPIDRISSVCGFETPGYFRRIFRRQVGMSPVEYRRLHCRMHIITD